MILLFFPPPLLNIPPPTLPSHYIKKNPDFLKYHEITFTLPPPPFKYYILKPPFPLACVCLLEISLPKNSNRDTPIPLQWQMIRFFFFPSLSRDISHPKPDIGDQECKDSYFPPPFLHWEKIWWKRLSTNCLLRVTHFPENIFSVQYKISLLPLVAPPFLFPLSFCDNIFLQLPPRSFFYYSTWFYFPVPAV